MTTILRRFTRTDRAYWKRRALAAEAKLQAIAELPIRQDENGLDVLDNDGVFAALYPEVAASRDSQ